MTVSVCTYRPSLKEDFVGLNTAWLREFFEVEEHDRQVFNNVEELIIRAGGEIFFCMADDRVVGTVAMQKMGEGVYELAKMAVAQSHRGRGLSNELMSACIGFAREKRAHKIVLVSNTGMVPAIRLYRKFGFVEVPLDETDYARADIQMELSLVDESPWDQIPLADYELHMSHEKVGQLALISDLSKKYLNLLKPKHCLFLGITGGNGLEHVDQRVTTMVTGIDISQRYLAETWRRFGSRVNGLRLMKVDVARKTGRITGADMIWAPLVIEYTGIDKALEFSKNNMNPGGHLVATIQVNQGADSVSPTGIASVQKASGVFRVVEEEDLVEEGTMKGFRLIDKEENSVPGGKSLTTLLFQFH